ncbi:DUF2339 domain-containing protein [Chitinophaga sancti]|uniref:DUF2339 domain-containing protein n=1 Tax=Chitinophaga sancti TaxID=1004 RepID=A0A1K1QLV1_9BACT|nr:DUF2339 domain-containing protein [Chitinophaga sancti]WQD65114.1 DUF2339 domain-containing protein [Chitinophaga sancti]WQG89262.1 DUF2339 domain-containing protein [Chitinophaga sancti]SFW60904.1 Predicted membrane protein [Chitinophaga sancti]
MFETIILLLLIVILVIVLLTKSEMQAQMRMLNSRMDQLQATKREWDTTTVIDTAPPPVYTPPPANTPPPPPQPVAPPPPPLPPPPVTNLEPVQQRAPALVEEKIIATPTVTIEDTPPPPPAPTFWEKYPDLEKFIGENLFNKIGIGVLVIGIGFFLKYAIDKNWINETGRTFIGILCGGILLGIAHRMRKSFAAFSSVLVGGGVAILYFSITIAFQQYHLIGQAPAFSMMVLITAFTVLLSISYNRVELAVLGILGGFTAPFLVSTGHGNANVLFTYILILNMGMLVLAYYKKWHLVNVISYLATVLLFGTWLSYSITTETPAKPVPYITALVFATLFYIIFFLMNVVNNIRLHRKFKEPEMILLLSNTFLYYSAGMVILSHIHGGMFQGLFTAMVAVFNFIFAYVLHKNKYADRLLLYFLIGLVLSFLSLAAPVQLKGHYITLFWAAESVLLLYLYQRSELKLMKIASLLVLVLAAISLIMDWFKVYGYNMADMTPVINRGFITNLACIAALYLYRRFLNKEQDTNFFPVLPLPHVKLLLDLALIALVYTTVQLEVFFQYHKYATPIARQMTHFVNYLTLCVLLYLSSKGQVIFRYIVMVLTFIALIVFIGDNSTAALFRNRWLQGENYGRYFGSYFIIPPVIIAMVYMLWRYLKPLFNKKQAFLLQVLNTLVILFTISSLLDHLVVLIAFHPHADIYNIVQSNQKTGYSILWGTYAFVLMFLGLKWSDKNVRIIAIALFCITIIKLFLIDIRSLSEGGKIAAFISLGVLLLIISFMYQRLKKIILDDKQEQEV